MEAPTGITVKLSRWDAADFKVGRDAEFGSELGDIFVIFKVGPKTDLTARTEC